MNSEDSIINKYRPQSFEQVYGHEKAIAALTRVIDAAHRPHTYLITGPSGIGKTSIARLIGGYLGAETIEIDAASHSGVDDARELVDLSQYMSLQGDGNRLYIIDECHTLSRNAWQALLKLAEEPPDHFYLVLCTTDADKVPATVRGQRAYMLQLRPLPSKIIEEYIMAICFAEDWNAVYPAVFRAIIANAEGSPRKALMLLLAVHDAVSADAVRDVIASMDTGEPVVQICQLLLKSGAQTSWKDVQPLLAKIENDEFDAAITHATRYMISCLMRANQDSHASRINEYIQALTFPSETFDSKARFFAAIGRCIWKG